MKRMQKKALAPRWDRVTTPQGVFTWPGLSREFYRRFAAALGWRSEVSRSSPISVCWKGRGGRLENIYVRAYMRPIDSATQDEPAIPRIVMNHNMLFNARSMAARLGIVDSGYLGRIDPPEKPRLELSCLPAELFDFAPWLAERVKLYGTGHEDALPQPPHTLQDNDLETLWSHYLWTDAAWLMVEAYNQRQRERRERRGLLERVREGGAR